MFSGDRLIEFEYTGPLDVVSELKTNVEILSFDEIMDIFESQIEMDAYGWDASTVKVTVDQAVLGLSRIRMKNDETDFYLVPSYTFSGTVTYYDADGEAVTWMDDDGNVTAMAIQMQFLTTDAVDGTVIDTELGY